MLTDRAAGAIRVTHQGPELDGRRRVPRADAPQCVRRLESVPRHGNPRQRLLSRELPPLEEALHGRRRNDPPRVGQILGALHRKRHGVVLQRDVELKRPAMDQHAGRSRLALLRGASVSIIIINSFVVDLQTVEVAAGRHDDDLVHDREIRHGPLIHIHDPLRHLDAQLQLRGDLEEHLNDLRRREHGVLPRVRALEGGELRAGAGEQRDGQDGDETDAGGFHLVFRTEFRGGAGRWIGD